MRKTALKKWKKSIMEILLSWSVFCVFDVLFMNKIINVLVI